MHCKLFEVPFPSCTNQSTKLFILSHTLELLLGNMNKMIREEMHQESITIENLVLE